MCLGPMEPCTTPCMSKLTLLLQIMNINESPVFLLMDTDMTRRHKDLPGLLV